MIGNRGTTDKYKIGSNYFIAPDQDADQSYEDIDAPTTGRDESGVMHRDIVREKVGSWSFNYSHINEHDYAYMESIFRNISSTMGGRAVFMFTHPDPLHPGSLITTQCYRSKYSISWHNVKKGEWRNYKFDIIEC